MFEIFHNKMLRYDLVKINMAKVYVLCCVLWYIVLCIMWYIVCHVGVVFCVICGMWYL